MKCFRPRFTIRTLTIFVTLVCESLLLFFVSTVVSAENASFDNLRKQYDEEIHPILAQFCLDCHSTEKQEGELDLQRFATLAEVRRDPKAWQQVADMLDNGEMPPEDSEQPSAEQRKQLRSWIDLYLNAETLANAGDPGPIVLRRLSNAEYTYTIQDLTGVESLEPTREFPVDGAAGEGFTNTGSAHALTSGKKTIDDIAGERTLSPRYLAVLWQALSAASQDNASLLIDSLRNKWQGSKMLPHWRRRSPRHNGLCGSSTRSARLVEKRGRNRGWKP